MMILS